MNDWSDINAAFPGFNEDLAWTATGILPLYGSAFKQIRLSDKPEVYDAFALLVASGCIEMRCVISLTRPSVGERLDAELRFCGCQCDPFTTEGKRTLVWHALDHAGWIDADGATPKENIELSIDTDARITGRGHTVLEISKRIGQPENQENRQALKDGMYVLLRQKMGRRPQVLYCRKTAISAAADSACAKADFKAVTDSSAQKCGASNSASLQKSKKHLRLTVCGGSGNEARYIDLKNIAHACDGASIRSIRELDKKAAHGEPPEANGTKWKGPVAHAYTPKKDGGISEKRLNLYDLANVRAYFGRIDSAALKPRNVYLAMDDER